MGGKTEGGLGRTIGKYYYDIFWLIFFQLESLDKDNSLMKWGENCILKQHQH